VASLIAVRGGNPLEGEVKASGAKNAALPAIVASLLTEEPLVLSGVPRLLDVETQLSLVEALGKEVRWEGQRVVISGALSRDEAPAEIVSRMRASFLALGPIVVRLGRARVPLPGGCVLGARPVDLHLHILERLGASVELRDGVASARVGRMRGRRIWLRYPSVGATEQALLVGAVIPGETEVVNPAREPEVADLCGLLRCMGAEVEVRPDRIIVRGRRELRGCEYRIIPDRIEAGTYLLAGAITRGRVRVEGAVPEHMDALIALLEESGLEVSRGEGGVEVDARGRSWVGIEVETAPYPGFPTDLQPPLTAFLTLAQGKSILRETVFESRFGHVGELLRMGARIGVHDRTISVQGVAELKGADLRATDIRAGAALVLAALAAQGTSRISGVEHIRRGYENILGKLALLGAEVWEEESAT